MTADDAARSSGSATAGAEYAARLRRLDQSRWRRVLNVQAPYRWNIRRLQLGRVLDVGCGLGRNLAHLGNDSVGVDHNAESIAIARERGLTAFTSAEFLSSGFAVHGAFDSLLFAHVIEHVSREYAVGLVREYLPYLKPGGTVCFITPQERGYASDTTHVTFTDFTDLDRLSRATGLVPVRHYSFPLPRAAGKAFLYNEFVFLARAAA
ncbi:class I SAM-dependent methyltransferase [Leifsonia shinshuensis]|uniref:Methyltransferase domain-containing protein n=1 Tax=Leifsonia shinshuensis TaxID=150026 RepID=A0A7G6YFS8_9MICO|nr:class I SAM-dependent methyltransferase [Leifsonia shinshuensis]QNE37343.1 methyltransferase domain-containing protein [Leifsonia shinshuensis]